MSPPTIAPTLIFPPPSEGGVSVPRILVEVLVSAVEEGIGTTPTWVRVTVAVEVTRTHVETVTVLVGVGVGAVTVRVREPLTVVGTIVLVRVEEDPGIGMNTVFVTA